MEKMKTYYVVEEDGEVVAVFDSLEEAEEAGYDNAQPREMSTEEAEQLKQKASEDEEETDWDDEDDLDMDWDDHDEE